MEISRLPTQHPTDPTLLRIGWTCAVSEVYQDMYQDFTLEQLDAEIALQGGIEPIYNFQLAVFQNNVSAVNALIKQEQKQQDKLAMTEQESVAADALLTQQIQDSITALPQSVELDLEDLSS